MAVFIGLNDSNPLSVSNTAKSVSNALTTGAGAALLRATNPVANIVSSITTAKTSGSGLLGAIKDFTDNTFTGQVANHAPAALDAADRALGGDGFFYEGVDPIDTPNNPARPSNPTTPVTPVPSDGGTSVPVQSDYLFADLAKAYGMDSATAYQEALSNTSYQRAVADLQRAGLNPILATGQGASSGVYGAQLAGDGKVSTGVSTAKSAHTWYNILSNVGEAVGAVVGKGYVGSKAGKAIGTVIGNLFDGFY